MIRTIAETGPCVVAARSAPAPSTAKRPRARAGPCPQPDLPQGSAEQGPGGEGRGEKATRRAAAEAHEGGERFGDQERHEEQGRDRAVEEQLRDVLAVTEHLGQGARDGADQTSPRTGATSRIQPFGRLRSAQATARTQPTAATPMIGPAASAKQSPEAPPPSVAIL